MTAKELNEVLTKAGTVLHGDRVAVAREKRVTQTRSGLFIPETAQARQNYGAIVLIGNECKMDVKVGDAIYVPIYGGVLMRQPVGNDIFLVEVLNSKDIFITYVQDGAELEADGGNVQG